MGVSPRGALGRFGDRVWLRRLGWATLVANVGIVLTGGAVRLTASGLGCPTWPRCTDESFTPHGALDFHSAIEFGNRTLTFVLAAIAVATFVTAWQSGRRDLRVLALWLGLGVPAQALVGGLTVHDGPEPVDRLVPPARVPGDHQPRRALPPPHRRPGCHGAPTRLAPRAVLAWTTYAVTWVVLYLGTVVTGSGPHAGDVDVPRNGLDPLLLSQLHADFVFLLVGLTVALVIVHPSRATWTLLGVELAQGLVGFVQYFNDLPVVLVGFHLLGAALIAAASTWMVIVWVRPLFQPGATRRCDGMCPVADHRRGGLMLRTASRRGGQALVVATLLLATGCGTTEPEPVEALEPIVPADLCALVPADLREGLIFNANNSDTGNPTAACSLRSPDNAKTQVRAVVTWVQLNEEYSADEVLDSQCRSIDPQEFRMQDGFTAEGAERACAGSGTVNGADSASMAALTDREVITVRLDYEPKGKESAMTVGKQMMEGVISAMAGKP